MKRGPGVCVVAVLLFLACDGVFADLAHTTTPQHSMSTGLQAIEKLLESAQRTGKRVSRLVNRSIKTFNHRQQKSRGFHEQQLIQTSTAKLCNTPPTILNGKYIGENANFYDGQDLSVGVVCYAGYLRSSQGNSFTCTCTSTGGQCKPLEHACEGLSTRFDEAPFLWVTRRGDPPTSGGAATFGFFAPSLIIAVLANFGWLTISSFIAILLFDIQHPKMVYMGLQAVTVQYLYAILLAAYGSPASGICYTKRKALNWIIGDVLLILLLSSMLHVRNTKLRNDALTKAFHTKTNNDDKPQEYNDESESENYLAQVEADAESDDDKHDDSDINTKAKDEFRIREAIAKIQKFASHQEVWIGVAMLHIYAMIVWMFVSCGSSPSAGAQLSPRALAKYGAESTESLITKQA